MISYLRGSKEKCINAGEGLFYKEKYTVWQISLLQSFLYSPFSTLNFIDEINKIK